MAELGMALVAVAAVLLLRLLLLIWAAAVLDPDRAFDALWPDGLPGPGQDGDQR